MSTTTLTALANAAAQDIGVLDSGETLSAQQLADSLDIANKILDNWSSEQIQVPCVSQSIVTLAANNNQYAVGAAQAWNINPGPVRITSASLIMSNNVTLPIKVVTSAQWDQIPDRSGTSNLIQYLFYTPNAAAPGFGLALVAPVPNSGGASLWIQYWRPFTQFADTTSVNTLIPAGYLLALEYELARALASKLDVPWSQVNDTALKEYMIRLRQLNAKLWGDIEAGASAQQ